MQDLETRFQESLDFLYSFIDYSLKRNFRNAAEKFNLDRMRHFMSLMGDPQKDYGIIHVAGTKGKGSVSSMCASVLKAEGLPDRTLHQPAHGGFHREDSHQR